MRREDKLKQLEAPAERHGWYLVEIRIGEYRRLRLRAWYNKDSVGLWYIGEGDPGRHTEAVLNIMPEARLTIVESWRSYEERRRRK